MTSVPSPAPSAGAGERKQQPNAVGYAAYVRRQVEYANIRARDAHFSNPRHAAVHRTDAAALTALAELLEEVGPLLREFAHTSRGVIWVHNPDRAAIRFGKLLQLLHAGYHPTPEPEPQG